MLQVFIHEGGSKMSEKETAVIKSNVLTVSSVAEGAMLTSIRAGQTEFLWQGDPEFWSGQSPVCFPICGSLRGDAAKCGAVEVKNIKRHGFARFETFEITSQDEQSVTYVLNSSPATKEIYPYDFRFALSYRVEENRLTFSYKVKNTGDVPMPFFIGGHPAFNCPLFGGESYEDYVKATGYKDNLRTRGLVFSYALAVSEENAAGGKIVTAPTCGSCGVLPGVLYHMWKSRDFSEARILRALATAGLFGNVVKEHASISGAEVGCQGEVGVACAMAAAAASQLFGGSPAQIEYAAEMGLEHHLGMTCDPVCGMVQIPCIERNAYAAARALDANIYSTFSDGIHRVSFDKVVEVMRQTGHDLPSLYKETAEGGLAKDYKQM